MLTRKLDAGLAPATVGKIRGVLHSALEGAIRTRLLATNPVTATTPPKVPRHEMRTLDEGGVARLLAASRDTPIEIPVLLALALGMRRGELLGLRWADIDLQAGTLSVRRTLTEAAGKRVFGEPKTPRSRRMIALPESVLEALRRHRAQQAQTHLSLGPLYHDDDLVCCQPNGAPWWPSDFDRTFRRVKKKAKVDVRFHDLRHTFATRALKAGIHPKIVSEILGHASVAITLDLYSHVVPGLQERAAETIDEGLRQAMGL